MQLPRHVIITFSLVRDAQTFVTAALPQLLPSVHRHPISLQPHQLWVSPLFYFVLTILTGACDIWLWFSLRFSSSNDVAHFSCFNFPLVHPVLWNILSRLLSMFYWVFTNFTIGFGAPGWLGGLCPTSAQVTISRFISSSPTWGSVLHGPCCRSSVSLSLCPALEFILSLSL